MSRFRAHDVSMVLRDGMPVFPGNPPFRREATRAIRRGDAANESLLTFGSHCGTHVDAPLHFIEGGAAIDAIPIERFLGPARLFDLTAVDRIDRPDLERLDWNGVTRALFKTRNSEHWERGGAFDHDFVALAPAAADFLVERKLLLVGVDGLSVERAQDGAHPVHVALLRAGIVVIEGLRLARVVAGDYLLFCGVLNLADADGAPARVVLVERE